jgi:hypothetical protein
MNRLVGNKNIIQWILLAYYLHAQQVISIFPADHRNMLQELCNRHAKIRILTRKPQQHIMLTFLF